jgi:hypothetical protein
MRIDPGGVINEDSALRTRGLVALALSWLGKVPIRFHTKDNFQHQILLINESTVKSLEKTESKKKAIFCTLVI